ncbi:MAG: ribosomal-processing cysteine protease Prp, partial [Clostridia bacterium]
MTTIKIKKENGSIVRVTSSGHAGYRDGEDIVCAGISTILQTALLGLLSVAGINVKFDRDEEEGFLQFTLPEDMSREQRHDADVILGTMLCGLTDFYQEYSD